MKSVSRDPASKKVILVHPPMYLRSLYGDLADAGSELPPQGLCALAAVLRRGNYQPVIIDGTAEKLNIRQTLYRIKQNLPALFVGFSLYYVAEQTVSRLAKLLKADNSGLPIVVGGGHASIMKEKILENYPEIDISVIGEGEETVIALASTLEQKQDLDIVKGIIFRKEDKVVVNPPRPPLQNLDKFPFPAWDLLPSLTKYYQPAGDSLKRSPSTILISSRGCPGNCFFCNKNMFGSKVRQNSPQYVIAEMRYLRKQFGIRDIYFADDTFIANHDWVMIFCRLLLKEKIDITWSCHGRTDLVDLPLLQLMKKAGCWQICFGIESGSQKVLDAINKQITVEQNKKALKMCQQAGLAVKGLFMVGSFGENRDTIEETKRFLKENYMTEFHATCFVVLPGTVAEKIWPRYGKNPKSKIPPITAYPSFIPFGLTKKELIRVHKDLYRTFYFRWRIMWHFFKKFQDIGQIGKIVRSSLALLRYVVSY